MLSLAGVKASYGASQALYGVDLELAAGEVVALLGRNGMGKSTTMRAIMRLVPPSAGRILFGGRSLEGLPAQIVARLGLGYVPEGRRVFVRLNVEENLLATARPGAWNLAGVYDLFPRLRERARNSARTLSGGEQQMLAIGRALMTNPKLLLLDEATEGLAPLVRAEIWRQLAALKASGLGILLVDKNVQHLATFADRFVILQGGRSVWHGDSSDILDDQSLLLNKLGL